MLWLIRTICAILVVAATAGYSCKHYPDSWFWNGTLIGTIFCQSAHLMHDCTHRLVHRNTNVCYTLGWFAGNLGFGINSRWWHYEHDRHHGATNSWDRVSGTIFDTHEESDFSVQSEDLFGLYQLLPAPLFIRYQRWFTSLFLPFMLSKYGLTIRSYISFKEKKPIYWLGLFLHI